MRRTKVRRFKIYREQQRKTKLIIRTEREKMEEDLEQIYNDLIMEHSMNSYNKKKLASCDFCEIGHNPNCR